MKIDITIGSFWMLCYLFTIGFAKLAGWALLWAVLIWPIYVGDVVRSLIGGAP